MIRQLRNRFIRITMLSVSVVMLILTLIVNTANFISTNSDLEKLLDMICENRGSIPVDQFIPDAKPDKPADAVDSSDSEPTSTTPPVIPDSNADSSLANDQADPATRNNPDTEDKINTTDGDQLSTDNNQLSTDNNQPSTNDTNPPTQPWKFKAHMNPETPYSTRFFSLLFDQDGNVIQKDLAHIAAITDDDIAEYISVALKHGEGYGYYSDYKYRVILQDNQEYMVVFLDCYQEIHAIRVLALCSFAAMVICIGLVYILVVIFSKRAIDPVVRSQKQQKQFITDASHELKTPITVIATSLKVLEMEVGKQKWIDKARSQTEKLRELVNSLVTLSRMDEEDSPLKFEHFSISDALLETVDSFADYAESNGHALKVNITPDLDFYGDEYAIRQLASILLDNAVKYAAAGSDITFSLVKNKKHILLKTSNACQNLDEDSLRHLFDRFYRPDQSRSHETGGFGIGLSIARSIAEGHKGTIHACCPVKDQIEFTVKL